MHVPADPHLQLGPVPAGARGIVLMLHGGAEHGPQPIDERSLAYRRTRWMFRTIAGRFEAAGAGVALLRFTLKGWNASAAAVPSPVSDARRALATVRASYADLPTVLLGHSMGARAAAWVADDPAVVGVVGLAPWLPPDDPIDALTGRHLVAVHGSRDRITSPRATRRYVDRARTVAASARLVEMPGLGHYMFRGLQRWNDVAVAETLGVLDTVAGITSPS
jgi:alpha-beta hydrolase superfamily lysophospholipase